MSSKHDSSLKTLAVVTIKFLPGSFVAAVFSMPVFNWASEKTENIVNPHFSIYWAVTVPLTLITFIFYGVWLLIHQWIRNQNQNQKNNDTARGLDENPGVAEFRKLTCKWKDILHSVN